MLVSTFPQVPSNIPNPSLTVEETMIKKLGGGKETFVDVLIGEKKQYLKVRRDIFGVKLGICLIPATAAGMFVVPNQELARLRAKGQEDPKLYEWQIVTSVYYAFRQTEHTLFQYGIDLKNGEKSVIEQARERSLELNLRVLGISRGPRVEEALSDVARLVDQITTPLRRARKLTKKEAARQIRSITFTDAKAVNIGADRARTIKASTELDARLQEIMTIEPRIVPRWKVLLSLIHLAELRLAALKHFLDLILCPAGLKTLVHSFSFQGRAPMAAQCEFLAQSLDQIDFKPYLNMCILTAKDLRTARDMLRKKSLDQKELELLTAILERCRTAVTIKNWQVEIERIILKVFRREMRGQPLVPDPLLENINTVERHLASINDSILEKPVCAKAVGNLQAASAALREYKTALTADNEENRHATLETLKVELRHATNEL